MPLKNMIGLRFTRLLVVSQAESDPNGNARWNCQCDCGNTTTSFGFTLRNGTAASCGCLNTENLVQRITTHDRSKTPEYKAWVAMHERCTKPANKSYPRYGGRGIRVCSAWTTFEAFYADMGGRPSPKHSIERRSNDGNYEPSNCYWATAREQANNTSQNRKVVYRGEEMNLVQAIRAGGDVISFGGAQWRLASGWSVEETVETPPGGYPR